MIMLEVHCYSNCEEKTADSPTARIYAPLLVKHKKTTIKRGGMM